jgi:glycosyltransferase involved in cell wall biosynthesis
LTAHAWAAPERIYHLANGVEPECFMDRGPAARVRRLLFVGQWLPAKGTRDLVEAFATLAGRADLELACVGTRRADAQVLADFPEAVRGRVRVRRAWTAARCTPSLRHADLFVFPSLSEDSATRCSRRWPRRCRSWRRRWARQSICCATASTRRWCPRRMHRP